MLIGERAHRASCPPLGLKCKAAIETRQIVFERDHRRQIDQLLLGKQSPQLFEQHVWHLGWRDRETEGVVEGELLEVREGIAVTVIRKREYFVFCDPQISAPGRVDVDSRRAADSHRRA